MTRHVRSLSLGALCLLLAACSRDEAPPTQAPHPISVIPAPAQVVMNRGAFELSAATPVRYTAGSPGEQVAKYFVDLMQRTRGVALSAAAGEASERSISFQLEAHEGSQVGEEAYSLVVSPGRIVVSSHSPRGLFYGAVTLWQLAAASSSIPALAIADAPRFRWRGLMLDSARHYQSPQFIERLIDTMALHKLNVLHWHLTDDQGWRLEIKKYPRLTEIGAWRIPAGASWPTSPDPATGRRPVYGGYYTQQEAREIVAYAAERFVTIVPEIDMPGHAQAAIASYPHLGTGGPPPPVSPDWGVHDFLFNADEPTMAFLEDVLAEVIDIFPGKFIHIGGDEAVKNRWKESPRVQARIRELGLADETALQGWFVARIGRFIESRGRRLIGWDEILESGVPLGAAVMSWRGTDGGVAAARAGHDVVMAPSPTLYLDHWQSDLPAEPPGRPAVMSLEDIYSYEPVPPGLAAADSTHILGTQVNAWTEHMRTSERVEHQTFPRAAALAEVAWSPADARDWTGFQARLPAQFARYRALELNYADSAFAPRFDIAASAASAMVHVTLSKQAAFGTIRITRDGSEPSPASAAYERGFDAPEGSIVKAAAYEGERLLGGPVALTVERRALRRRTDEQLTQCTGKLVLRLEDDAPLEGERAFFNVDIVDPCWIWRDADLTQGGSFRAAVGQLPFNFQIGKDADAIRRGDARTPAGELELRVGDCRGEPVAVIPIGSTAANPGLSILGPVKIPPQPARGDLCLRFARPAIDPLWAIQWAELE